jgi:hypothetical protein
MHEHDLDLIAALADGSTSDETEARSLIETCPVCRAEYEAQKEVIAWLGAAPQPAMTELERAALHRAVRSGIADVKPLATATPWWQRLGYVAAGLLVVVGLYGVLQNTGDGEADLVAADTTAAAGGAEAPTEEVPFVAEDASEGLDPLMAPSTTAAATEEATPETMESLTIPFARFADEARASQAERDASTTSAEDRECLARAGLDRHIVVREVEFEKTYLVVMPENPAEEDVVIFVELPGCSVVFEDR